MPGKIFYRERTKGLEQKKQPRFRMIAVADVNLKIYGEHLRKSELEAIAQAVGAKLILLPSVIRNKKTTKRLQSRTDRS